MSTYDIYAEKTDGWKYLGNCEDTSITLMVDLYGQETETRLLFVDAKVILMQHAQPGRPKFILDNVEHLLLKSMFPNIPDLVIIPKPEVINGLRNSPPVNFRITADVGIAGINYNAG